MDASPSSSSPIGLILFFFVLLVLSAYFAGSETSLSTVNRIRMMSYADDGDKRAKRVLYILDHFDEALATILIGNNIMHIGAASLATLTASRLWGEGAVGITTVVTTLLVFFAAEMIPKSLAKACSERFALFCAGSLLILMRLLKPVVKVFTALSNGMRKLTGVKKEEDPLVTEDELHELIDNYSQEKGVDEEKAELVQSALEFTETPVRDVFTPWEQVTVIKKSMPPREIASLIENNNHSRLPVVDEDGGVIGMLQIRKYLKAYIQRQGHVSLLRVMDKPTFVRTGAPIDELLDSMSAGKTHIAIVRDEQEKLVGIITVEDILEELVGEIYDEDDKGGEAVL